MKTISTSLKYSGLLAVVPAFVAALAIPAAAQAQSAKGAGELKVVSVESNDKDGDKSGGDVHKFEIRVEDGKLSVKRDGKEVPASEIKNADGRITIVDGS